MLLIHIIDFKSFCDKDEKLEDKEFSGQMSAVDDNVMMSVEVDLNKPLEKYLKNNTRIILK